ncbi:TadE/TadG family type IV pilus assembly protein [Caballeronia cordobensis]|uniref:TadE/TadG family type IV pilus assembly protein n=1 Tax=Caballeronia cordobensis TaxID=1353886 RepID=UPI00045F05E2|nr:TadE family protein [Burkholderia sp. RPE67]
MTRRPGRHAQRGNMAIEFAIVFPLFFVVFYAIVTYSIIFVAQQSLTLAAEEGARAALRFQANAQTVDDALARRATAACETAKNLTNWLASAALCSAAPAPCTYDASLRCIEVTLNYGYAQRPLVPTLPLFGLALPDSLIARAMVQLDPDNVL